MIVILIIVLLSIAMIVTRYCDTDISSITLTDGGAGYDFTPTVTIAAPSGITTHQATATASVTGGVVTSVSITGIGTGYDTQPLVLIQPQSLPQQSDQQALARSSALVQQAGVHRVSQRFESKQVRRV